ncbi:hypothetical protein OE88DRAFT_198527 [Heliocybe sulcata]|uniref:Uncharacterized protein n=1 Tax=Heliocybe sulcata TaxID=5364 RepID=A0A5C3N1N5_9AGAM|nr:hypothetical protein OE88DRAFT_198527 [Heliocybe sulcata]
MFAMLTSAEVAEWAAKLSQPSVRKPSIDWLQAETPCELLRRRKIQVLLRSNPLTDEKSKEEMPSVPRAGCEPIMSEEEAKRRIAEDSKEFFAVRELNEAEGYFTKLSPGHRFRLVDSLLNKAIESIAIDAELVTSLFRRPAEKHPGCPSCLLS